jgi:hypothetical protein
LSTIVKHFEENPTTEWLVDLLTSRKWRGF